MKFAILGAGALGTILGAHLSRAGHEVVMIARGDRARVLQRQGLVLNGLSDIKARPMVIDDPRKLLDTGTLIIATKAIDSAKSLDTLEASASSRMPSRCRTACSRTNCWRRVFGLFARARRHGGFQRRTAGQWRSEVHAQCLPAPRGGEGRHEPARAVARGAHRRRRRALRGGVQHQHARVVEVRRMDRAVPAGGAHAADHLEIPHGRAAAPWSSCASCAKRRRSPRPCSIELTDMPPLPVPSIVHGTDAQAIEIVRGIGQKFLDIFARTSHVRAAGCVARQPARVPGNAGLRAAEGARAERAHAHARRLLPDHRRGPPMKGVSPHFLENGARPRSSSLDLRRMAYGSSFE